MSTHGTKPRFAAVLNFRTLLDVKRTLCACRGRVDPSCWQ
jgi:hypothetical protein